MARKIYNWKDLELNGLGFYRKKESQHLRFYSGCWLPIQRASNLVNNAYEQAALSERRRQCSTLEALFTVKIYLVIPSASSIHADDHTRALMAAFRPCRVLGSDVGLRNSPSSSLGLLGITFWYLGPTENQWPKCYGNWPKTRKNTENGQNLSHISPCTIFITNCMPLEDLRKLPQQSERNFSKSMKVFEEKKKEMLIS